MATTKKKPATKKPATKKPATKKPATKKSATKKSATKKSATKKPATKKPAAKSKPAPKPEQPDLATLAMAGDLDGLLAVLDPFENDDDADELYKWCEVASEHAPTAKLRKAAEDMLDAVMTGTSLHYDDDQIVTGNVHFDLGVAYLTAGEGLPRDLERAAGQLAMAKERYFPWSIQGADKLLKGARKKLAADALAVFDKVYDGTKPEPTEGGDSDDEEY